MMTMLPSTIECGQRSEGGETGGEALNPATSEKYEHECSVRLKLGTSRLTMALGHTRQVISSSSGN